MSERHDGPAPIRLGPPGTAFFSLPEAEREALERAALEDDELFASLEDAEDALVEGWVRGELPPAQRESCERLLAASPRLRERTELVRLLDARARRDRGARTASARWLALAAGLVLTAGLAGLVAQRQTAGPPVAPASAPGAAGHPATFLPLATTRGGAGPIELAADGTLLLRVEVGEDRGGRFRLRLSDAAGRDVAVLDELRAEPWRGAVVVAAEVRGLPRDADRLLLTVESLGGDGSATPIAYHELSVARAP